MEIPQQPWTRSIDEIVQTLGVAPDTGLSQSDVQERRERFGANRLQETESRSTWQILWEQFQNVIVALLVVAAIVSFAFGENVEALAILVVILINAAIGFITELRAVRSMEALQEMGGIDARARRDGEETVVDAEALVPGDIVILESGDTVTADVRLLEANKLQANESALTGESVPVSKQTGTVDEDAPLAERASMVFKGTAITRGSGEGVVVATGMETELGEISTLVEEAEEEVTPLEERLDQLGRKLVWVTLAIAALVAVTGIIAGKEAFLIIETAIALAVATVPEGLPIVATMALARGMWRMARRNALIEQLSAVETLGATNVILTDKTGTLTENQMTVTQFNLPDGTVEVSGEGLETDGAFTRDDQTLNPDEEAVLRQALEVGVLCNNAAVSGNDDGDEETEAVGEPMEVALLVAGEKAGIERQDLLEGTPEVREVAFDPAVKMMATFHRQNDHYRVAVKGAPEAVLDASTHTLTPAGEEPLADAQRQHWLDENQHMAEDGLRVLALAQKTAKDEEAEPYEGLTFLGLVGLLDPPREEVYESLEACRRAGIRVIMVTGDQPVTARKVGTAVGMVPEEEAEAVRGTALAEDGSRPGDEDLLDKPIFARVSPKQKLDLITMHQEQGNIVAMTGDGVNDAPALKKADIGVAMGRRGTQVAQEAAHMVLQDDAFSTIVAAIEQGRVIFDNIRKFVFYLISCNVSEIMVVALASLTNAPLPLLPLQILFLNLVTDVFPALALGVGEGSEQIMDRPPRDPQESILTRRHWAGIAGYGTLITASVLGAFALAFTWLDAGDELAVTISFLTLALAQLWHVFNMRDPGTGIVRNEVTRNPFVWGALVLCVLLLLAAVYIPFLANLLGVTRPGLQGWSLILGMSLLPLILGQFFQLPFFSGLWDRVGAMLE